MALDLLGLLAAACPQMYNQGQRLIEVHGNLCSMPSISSYPFLHLSNAPSRSFHSSACEMQANGSSISVLCFDLNSTTSIFFISFNWHCSQTHRL